jgi:hypothetical protein
MLSEITVAHLSTLTYRGDAATKVCWLPLSGIYWEDELPDIGDLTKMPEEDRHQILRLFGLRLRVWRGEALSDESQLFWDEMHAQVREWAFFQRLTLSADHHRAQAEAEEASTFVLEALLADADEVTIREKDGVQSFSATFDLTKEQRAGRKARSWWQRIFRRRRCGRESQWT